MARHFLLIASFLSYCTWPQILVCFDLNLKEKKVQINIFTVTSVGGEKHILIAVFNLYFVLTVVFPSGLLFQLQLINVKSLTTNLNLCLLVNVLSRHLILFFL